MAEEIKEIKEVKDEAKGKAHPKGAKPADAAGAEGQKPKGAEGEGAPAVKIKKKIKRNVSTGVINIQATFNNTIITISDAQGNVLCWSTAGAKGFKGSKKGTPFAAQLAAETACRKAVEYGMKTVSVYVRGPGAGRESALRAIAHSGIKASVIRDLTPIPHNGCRPPKRRRI
ncbi:MAG: 30S ribosomal protein S11 [Deltaproteobacteria bacterium]|nr:30S ribosomal protein S11 [Deltaproteobacteria bacterium]